MKLNDLDLLKVNQEKRAIRILLIIFYSVFFLYEMYLRFGKFHQVVLGNDDYQLFTMFQFILYTLLMTIYPISLILIRKNKVFQIKYMCFLVYFFSYILFEILVYHFIQAPYFTATIIDMIFVLITPILINKRYFWIVFSMIFLKITIVAFITQSAIVGLGVSIIFFLGIISYIILIRFINYLKKTTELFEAKIELEMYKIIAYKDDLTNVYSKRYMNLELKELDQQGVKEIGLVMLDIDRFKEINDRYNHDVGDQVIKLFVECIKSELDFDNVIGRFGGDEFIIILKNKTYEEMKSLIVSIRDKLQVTHFKINFNNELLTLHLTASFGLYYLSQNDPKTPQEALKEADNLLVQSKQNGNNQFLSN